MSNVLEKSPFSQVELSLYPGPDYFEEIKKQITATELGSRVLIMTMCFEPSEVLVEQTVSTLRSAAERGAEVSLGVDAYAFMINTGKPFSVGSSLSPITRNNALFERRQLVLDDLASNKNANVAIINKPSRLLTNPYSGRSHIKGAIIDDEVYLGGPNLHLTNRIDAAVGFQDRTTADWLYELTSTLMATGSTARTFGKNDLQRRVDSSTELIIDSGQPNQSMILDQALERIDEAKEWITFSSQFVPNGQVADRLIAAEQRGLDVQLTYNDPATWGKLGGILQRRVLAKQQRRAPGLFKNGKLPVEAPMLHAKTLATEQGAMVSTHNLSDAGVRYGTPEIALFRNSLEFAHAVRTLIDDQVELALSSLR